MEKRIDTKHGIKVCGMQYFMFGECVCTVGCVCKSVAGLCVVSMCVVSMCVPRCVCRYVAGLSVVCECTVVCACGVCAPWLVCVERVHHG